MLEQSFFNYMLHYFREQKWSIFYHAPLKSSYPLLVLEHKETHVFLDESLIHFSLNLLMDKGDQSACSTDIAKVAQLLENTPNFDNYAVSIRIQKKQQLPLEQGKPRQCIFQCVARILTVEGL